ncbi:MAG: biotin--[acetyl-CoA-carboxylase] ligase [Planctomycetota bacterium]|jgi:BirA family biotin operon repressor/biotin-[acetyl-CoA-carboxylase] ligase
MTPQARWTLVTRHLGWEVRVFEQLESTNTHLLELAGDPTLHGLVVMARAQTAGRGQYGRVWSAPPQSSVLASLLLYPPPALRRPVVVTAWAAVAVCEVIKQTTGLDARIKWPNDILVAGKKVCGFLIEQRTTGLAQTPLATVVGFGLNVNQSAASFAAAGLPDAASLTSLSGKTLTIDALAQAIIQRLDDDYESLLTGNLGILEAAWQWRLGLVDKPIIAQCADGPHIGDLIDASFDAITLRSDGELIRLLPESILHLNPYVESAANRDL